MDFSFKSKSWAGSIYHQFESICQDVDGFVNKEAVKFVENQVQSVGMSVKKLYSDVVQEILPLSGDTAKPERQLTAGEQVDTQDRVASSIYADEIKLAENQVPNDHKIQCSKPADVAEAQDLTDQGNATVQNSVSAEKNVTADLKPVTANSSCDGDFFPGKSDEDISTSPASSAQEEGSTFIEEERKDLNGDEDFSGDTTCLSDTQGNATVQNSEDSITSAEKNVAADFDGAIFSGQSDEDISTSPASSAREEASTFIEEERWDFDLQLGDEGFSGNTMCLSDSSTEQGNVTVQNSEDCIISAEENATTDFKPVAANSSFDGEVFSGKSDEDKSTSPASSAHEEASTFIEEERWGFDLQIGDEGFSGDSMCISDSSTEQGNATVQNSEDSIINAEENIATYLKLLTANSSFNGEIFRGMSDEDASSSPASSAHEGSSTFIEEERRDFNGDEGFSGDTMCLSDSSTEQGNATVQHSEDNIISAEKNDLKPVTANSNFDGELFSGKSDDDMSASPASLAHEEGSTFIEEEIRDFNHQKVAEVFSGDSMCFSASSSASWLSDSMLPMIDDIDLDVLGSVSSPPVPVSAHNVNQDNCQLMDSPVSVASDVEDGALSKSCSTKDDSVDLSTYVQSSELVFSYSCDENEEQIVANMPSNSCTYPKSSIATESTSADFSDEAARILHSRSVSDGCIYNIAAASSINVDEDPAFLMMESNDNNAWHTDRSASVGGSLEIGYEEHFKDGPSTIVKSPPETENKYRLSVPIGELDLENVDLSSKLKHDGRSVVSYSNFAAAGSYRRRDFRYYKKLIQGAFTSRKRLTKEYEHLTIMYGDLEEESYQHFKPSSLSSFPDTSLHAEGAQSSNEMSENEWELL